MEISLLDFLSPDFLIETVVKIPGLSARGLIESNTDLKFYYLDGIRRDKVYIEPIWKLANDIYEAYIEEDNTSYIIKDTIDKDKFVNFIIKDLLHTGNSNTNTNRPVYKFTYNNIFKFFDIKNILLLIYNNFKFENIEIPKFYFPNDIPKFINFLIENKNDKDINIDYMDDIITNYLNDNVNYNGIYKLFHINPSEGYYECESEIYKHIFNYISSIVEKLPNIVDLYKYQKYLIDNT